MQYTALSERRKICPSDTAGLPLKPVASSSDRIRTMPFNGYGEQVAGLYKKG